MNDLTDRWTPEHSKWLRENGAPMLSLRLKLRWYLAKPNPVYMHETTVDGTVETNEGPLTYKAGSFIAHDPISGHVWPVDSEYVTQHYKPA